MKKLTLIAALVFFATAVFAQTGNSIYQKYSGSKDVSGVYISPAMFKMMGRLPELDLGKDDVNITSAVESLEGMYILECENISLLPKLKEDVQKLATSGNYQLMMETVEDDELVRMYVSEKNGVITSFILFDVEKDECDFICLEGKISREQLNSLMGKRK